MFVCLFAPLVCSKRNWKKSGYFDTTQFVFIPLKSMRTFEGAIAAPDFQLTRLTPCLLSVWYCVLNPTPLVSLTTQLTSEADFIYAKSQAREKNYSRGISIQFWFACSRSTRLSCAQNAFFAYIHWFLDFIRLLVCRSVIILYLLNVGNL